MKASFGRKLVAVLIGIGIVAIIAWNAIQGAIIIIGLNKQPIKF